MTNTQLCLAVGLPCLAILTALVISMVHISRIRADMRFLYQKSPDDR
jgi:hypothetical protein